MHIAMGVSEFDLANVPTVVTIGNFDGVHRGHQFVLQKTILQADARSAASVVLTFDPHPALVHRPGTAPAMLTGLKDRLELIAAEGIDATLVIDYSLEFAQLTPREFIETYVVGTLHAVAVVIGRDVRFGKDNCGDLATLQELGAEFGFDVVIVDDFGAPEGGERWSSSVVRQLVFSGEMIAVTALLGRPHRIRGEVVHGDARGREMGFPTANMSQASDGMIPADGVYAGWVSVVGGARALQKMPAAISIGTNPTFEGQQRRVESYVIDRKGLELYGEEVIVEFEQRLRPTLTFDSMETLIVQMNEDVERARLLLR
ncbi:bifunctional riboflavin kinase/FAD synthetase [Timonella senegalensis]|uniref:bifunctional riboflavin kinase/FAD synthetase n=1 Tax=Timonella senegalensis TaxID=1465825 RepID=UPI002FE31645